MMKSAIIEEGDSLSIISSILAPTPLPTPQTPISISLTDLTRAYVFTYLDSLSQDIIRATVRTMDMDVVAGYR